MWQKFVTWLFRIVGKLHCRLHWFRYQILITLISWTIPETKNTSIVITIVGWATCQKVPLIYHEKLHHGCNVIVGIYQKRRDKVLHRRLQDASQHQSRKCARYWQCDNNKMCNNEQQCIQISTQVHICIFKLTFQGTMKLGRLPVA